LNVEAALESILDRIHQAVRKADFTAFAMLAAETERLLDGLGPGMTQAGLDRMRKKANRNAACLTAAARGLRAARRRLADVQTAGQLVTYDIQGRRADVSQDMPARHRF
jgi:hypothetical protein